MHCQKTVAKLLLSCAGNAGAQPVCVWNIVNFHHMDLRRIGDVKCRQHMRNGIQRPKPLVDGYLENGGRGVDGRIHSPDTFAVPSSTEFEGPLTAVPSCLEAFVVKSPAENISCSQRTRQGRHA